MSTLTPKQKRFSEEYLVDCNAGAAYRRAGYSAVSDETAWVNGCKLLKNTKVAAYVSELQAQRSQRTQITADRVLQEIARIAFANIRQVASFNKEKGVEFKDSSELTDDETAAIAEVSSKKTTRSGENGELVETVDIKMKMHNKIAALELAAKHLGLLEKVEQEDKNPSSGIEFKLIGLDKEDDDESSDRESP